MECCITNSTGNAKTHPDLKIPQSQVPNRQEQEVGRPSISQHPSGQAETKRRVAVCDATDEAKEGRCHMRVIMKKF